MNRARLQSALTHPNVQAFLRAIRLGEGTSDEMGYRRIVGGKLFTDDSQHPNVRVWLPKYSVWSTAAGAYQIINPTWRALLRLYAFPDFSPECQDEAAVALIAGRWALEDVIAGRFADAVQKCSKEWASLPGSEAGQRIERMADVRAEYLAHGGTIATEGATNA
jgi:muramidase (phage lysozyme)